LISYDIDLKIRVLARIIPTFGMIKYHLIWTLCVYTKPKCI